MKTVEKVFCTTNGEDESALLSVRAGQPLGDALEAAQLRVHTVSKALSEMGEENEQGSVLYSLANELRTAEALLLSAITVAMRADRETA